MLNLFQHLPKNGIAGQARNDVVLKTENFFVFLQIISEN